MTPRLIFRSQTPSNISDKEEHNGRAINENSFVTCAGAGAGGVLLSVKRKQMFLRFRPDTRKERTHSQNWNNS